jgi:hypothetical protein
MRDVVVRYMYTKTDKNAIIIPDVEPETLSQWTPEFASFLPICNYKVPRPLSIDSELAERYNNVRVPVSNIWDLVFTLQYLTCRK